MAINDVLSDITQYVLRKMRNRTRLAGGGISGKISFEPTPNHSNIGSVMKAVSYCAMVLFLFVSTLAGMARAAARATEVPHEVLSSAESGAERLGNRCCMPGWAWGMLFVQDRP